MKKKKSTRKEWVAIIAAIVAAILFVSIFLMVEKEILSSFEVEKVVTAKAEIEAGTQITKENVGELFEISEYPAEFVVKDALTDPAELMGSVAANPIHEKEIVSRMDIDDRQGWIEAMEEPIEFTFSATSISAAVAGSVRGGDVIDVGITFQKEDGQAQFEPLGRSVYVKEVYNESGKLVDRLDKDTPCTMFRVVMEKTEGEELLERLREGDEVIVTLPQ